MTAVAPTVDQAVWDDLQQRLSATPLVRGVESQGWKHGVDHDYLVDVLQSWRQFDWLAAEQRIQALPWQRMSNGFNLVHQCAADPDAPAVVLLHGWPDSFLRFQKVLPLLVL